MAEGTKFRTVEENIKELKESSSVTDNRLNTIENTIQSLSKLMERSLAQPSPITISSSATLQTNPSDFKLFKGMRIEIPQFDGYDVDDLIFKIQEFFTLYNTLSEQRIKLASLHMTGAALTWYKWMQQTNLLTTWDAFLKALTIRFGSSLCDDPKAELKHHKQEISVEEYQVRF